MCDFFSAIVTPDGNAYFTEEDSHEEVIARIGLRDDLEHFVRVEYDCESGYGVHEREIPEWYEHIAAKAEASVKAAFTKVEPFHNDYIKIRQSAWAAYEKIEQPAWADCEKIRQSAWAVYTSQCEKIDEYVVEQRKNRGAEENA